jgi:hypothetical protein
MNIFIKNIQILFSQRKSKIFNVFSLKKHMNIFNKNIQMFFFRRKKNTREALTGRPEGSRG